MYRFAVVDDNKEDMRMFMDCFQKSCDAHHIEYICDQYVGSLSFNHSIVYDAVFLDIDMPGENGIILAKKIKENYHTKIIFISAHPDLVHQSLDVQPFHFMHKDSLDREGYIFASLFEELKKATKEIPVYTLDKDKKNILVSSITHIKSDDHMCNVYVFNDDNEYIIWDTLSNIFNGLKVHDFIDVRRSVIVNMKYIKDIKETKLILYNDQQFPLSRKYRVSVKERFRKYVEQHS